MRTHYSVAEYLKRKKKEKDVENSGEFKESARVCVWMPRLVSVHDACRDY